jgi:predicted transcriptional regulator
MDLPETLVKRLDLYVGVTERTRVNIMTEALEEYLDRQENAARAMMAKARPSWE